MYVRIGSQIDSEDSLCLRECDFCAILRHLITVRGTRRNWQLQICILLLTKKYIRRPFEHERDTISTVLGDDRLGVPYTGVDITTRMLIKAEEASLLSYRGKEGSSFEQRWRRMLTRQPVYMQHVSERS